MKDNLKFIIFITLLSLPFSACGIKPNSVDAPAKAEKPDTFPRTYPASK